MAAFDTLVGGIIACSRSQAEKRWRERYLGSPDKMIAMPALDQLLRLLALAFRSHEMRHDDVGTTELAFIFGKWV